MSGATQPASHSAHGFAAWIRQTRLNDWCRLLIQADDEIVRMASEAGIDWDTLRQQLPACGSLLRGNRVPVLSPRDRGRNAFLWHLNTNRYGDTWPCLVFMTFRHGGIHQIFHGYRWAWLNFISGSHPIQAPARRTVTAVRQEDESLRAAREALETERCLERFRTGCRQWQATTPATAEHTLLRWRLCGHGSEQLLARLDLRSFQHPRGEGLMVRLLNHEHGHCGFQQLHAAPLDTGGRTQHLIIRQRGMKRGSMVCIRASAGHEGWPIAMCEGLFTALSVALGWPGPIAVALDAGNLPAVRQMIQRPCVFFADHDAWARRNTGLLHAQQACRPGDRVILPAFAAEFAAEHADHQPTDFNDLQRLAGHAELLRQLRQGWPSHYQGDLPCPAY